MVQVPRLKNKEVAPGAADSRSRMSMETGGEQMLLGDRHRTHAHLGSLSSTKQKPSATGRGPETHPNPSYTVDGNVNWCSQCVKRYGHFSKN